MTRVQHHDVIVIGAGTAGMVAAIRLAEAGASVCVVARGIGSTHLAPGTIDILGYAPDRVQSPWEALAALAAEHADHPYALLGRELVGEALDWFLDLVARGALPGYRYIGSLERNILLPTAVGALKPSAAVPETLAGGDASQLGRLAVVGSPALRDFHPQLCADNLRRLGIDARGISIELEVERADESPLGLARRFEDEAWRASFIGRLAPLVRAEDHVALPAVLGITDPHAVLSDLETRLGRRVFEIPSLPPSVPGMRLFEILHHALRAAGGRIVIGAGVVAHHREGDRVVSVETATAGSNTTHVADMFVLASGGFHSGAIALDSYWHTHEQVLGLPLQGLPSAGEPRFVPTYSDEQPFSRVGVAVAGDLRARGAANVLVAGASLPGAVPWREASGEGIALASGYRAAQVVAAELGAEAIA